MTMLSVLILVAIISAIILVARRFSRLKPCPICVGVSLTWFFLLLARWLSYPIDPLIIGLLMGGSVVGVETLLAKRLTKPNPIGKILFIIVGFWSVYNLIVSDWLMLAIGLLLWLIVLFTMYQEAFNLKPKSDEIKKQLENCC